MIMTKESRRRRLLPVLVLAAAIALASAGCSSGKTIKAPSAGGASGTAMVLDNPSAPPALKAQALQQQQIGRQQAEALQQAYARQQLNGQKQAH
jgi:hypothetical protein